MTDQSEPAATSAVDYDPFAAETRQDPSFMHRLLRERCPVHKFEGHDHPLYTLTLAEDVRDELRQPSLWSSQYGQTPAYTEEPGLRTDPPEHTTYRRLLTPMFSARRVESLGAYATEIADQLIDQVIDKGSMDLYRDFSGILPTFVVASLLGVESERHADFRTWSAQFVLATQGGDREGERDAREQVYGYFRERFAERRAILEEDPSGGPDDVLRALLTTDHPDGRPFTEDELLPLLILVLAGGTDTMTYLFTNCVYRLLERRELWEAVCADPSLVDNAMEESLRFDPPVMGTYRTNTAPLVLHDVPIPANSKVLASFASANRDATIWEDPDTFRLDRDVKELRRRHLSFGSGIHQCIGAPLARIEGRAALHQLVTRIPSLHMTAKPRLVEASQMRGFNRMPVAWDV